MKFLGKELNFNGKKIYHEGHKPTASEIGAASINDNTTVTSSVWSSNKTQTQINSSYNTMNNRVELLEETMYSDFVMRSGDVMTGDLSIKKSNGEASKIKVYRTLNNNEIEGSMDVYNFDTGSVSLSTWDRTNNKQTSSYVFGETAFAAANVTSGTRPDLGTSSFRFNKGWLVKLDLKEGLYSTGNITVTGNSVNITGQLNVARTTSWTQMAVFQTNGDGNSSGDGNTHIGYYQASLGGYTHYFRGGGPVIIDNKQSLQLSSTWMKIGGKKLNLTSSTPSGAVAGDVWIQI